MLVGRVAAAEELAQQLPAGLGDMHLVELRDVRLRFAPRVGRHGEGDADGGVFRVRLVCLCLYLFFMTLFYGFEFVYDIDIAHFNFSPPLIGYGIAGVGTS